MEIYKNLKLNDKPIDIIVEEGKIKSIGKTNENGIDCGGLNVYPGLFDIHLHGCGGHDTMDEGGLLYISRLEAKYGTTAILPTTMTVSMEDIREITNQPLEDFGGAKILGFHLE